MAPRAAARTRLVIILAMVHPLRNVFVFVLAFALRLAALAAGPAHVRKLMCFATRPQLRILEPAVRFGVACLARHGPWPSVLRYTVEGYTSTVFTKCDQDCGLFNLRCCSSTICCAMLAPSITKDSFAASDKEPIGSRDIFSPHSRHLSSKDLCLV